MKSYLVATLFASFVPTAFANSQAFYCESSLGHAVGVYFIEETPRSPFIFTGEGWEQRFVKGAAYGTNVRVDFELRDYKIDFGSGQNLVLNFAVPFYDGQTSDEPPFVSGTFDGKAFSCIRESVIVEYTNLDRIVNGR